MTDWREEIIKEMRERLKREEEKREEQRRIDQRAPAFWKEIVEALKLFIKRANEELGNQVFVGTPTEEGSTFSFAVACDSGSGEELGGVLWNKTQQQITLTVRGGGGAAEFALALDESDNLVARDSTGGAINNADDLVQLFLRRLTKVESVTYSESAIDSRLLMERLPREIRRI